MLNKEIINKKNEENDNKFYFYNYIILLVNDV